MNGMTRNIDQQLQGFYAEKKLSADSIARLRGLVERKGASETSRVAAKSQRENLRMWQTVAVAATIAVAFLAGALFIVRRPQPGHGGPVAQDLSQAIAQEVAMRHGRCTHEIVFTAADLDALFVQMKKLDFSPVAPGRNLEKMKLIGAHYCKVNGQLAVHAMLVDQNGQVVSLFETRGLDSLGSLQQAKHLLGGTEVDLWQRNGVLIAFAKKA